MNLKSVLYRWAVKRIQKSLIYKDTQLTPDMLTKSGWIREEDSVRNKTYYVEANIKERDKVSIEFEGHYYRVWHGKDRTFIALESSAEWLQMYLLLRSKYVEFNCPKDIFKGKGI